MDLTSEQQSVLSLCQQGYNVFLTGQAGTGKTFLLKEIIQHLQVQHGVAQVGITATTGKAALPLSGLTIHSFFSIGLGKQSAYKLLDLLFSRDDITKKIKDLKVLIIDEVSMLDADLFEKLEFLCRHIRGNSHPFGGIQLILCGDFFQLPPVQGSYIFKSPLYDVCIDISVELQYIHRQHEPELIVLLKDARCGHFTSSSLDLLQRLKRPLTGSEKVVRLYPHKHDVEAYNLDSIRNMAGEEFSFSANDWGTDKTILKNCPAPSLVVIKKGAPVVLVRNLFHISSSLVNGLTGTIVDITSVGPIVCFDNGFVLCIKATDFPMFNSHGILLATRKQLPLQLAFALTVHRAQGMSIPRLQVGLKGCFEPGQMYVALSRATCLEGLQILPGFSLHFPRVSHEVSSFYDSKVVSCDKLPGLSPSKSKRSSQFTVTSAVPEDPTPSTDEDHVRFEKPPPIREEIDLSSILQTIFKNPMNSHALTSFFQQIGLSDLPHRPSSVTDFFSFLVDYFDHVIPSSCKFQHQFLKVLNLPETKFFWKLVSSPALSEVADDTVQAALWLCVKECFNYMIKSSSPTDSSDILLHEVVPCCRDVLHNSVLSGTVRNIGGWVIHKCWEQCLHMHSKKSYAIALRQLNSFVSDRNTILHTSKYPDSLHHIERINRGGLLHISDSLFEFFCCVESVASQIYIEKNVHLYRNDVTKVLENAMHSNFYLQSMFSSIIDAELESTLTGESDELCNLSFLFEGTVTISDKQDPHELDPVITNCDLSLFLFHLLISRYVNMRNKEFLRKLGNSFNTKKSVALRKELAAKSSTSSSTSPSNSTASSDQTISEPQADARQKRKRFFFRPWMREVLTADRDSGRAQHDDTLLQRAAQFGCTLQSLKGWHQRNKKKATSSES